MPRARFLKKALQGARPPEPVAMPVKEVGKVPQKRPFDPKLADPANYSVYSQRLHQRYEEAAAENKPHFTIGGKEVYFPWAPVTLLRPSAKMTPYQAQFQVPRQFNKLEFRDYLWHVYGLRALNITTQIKWSQWTRLRMSRFRTPQVKKMIIDMEQPFVWPAEDKTALDSHRLSQTLGFQKYEQEMGDRKGSDMKKPSKAFDGVMGPYPEAPRPFVAQAELRQLQNSRKAASRQARQNKDLDLIKRFVKL